MNYQCRTCRQMIDLEGLHVASHHPGQLPGVQTGTRDYLVKHSRIKMLLQLLMDWIPVRRGDDDEILDSILLITFALIRSSCLFCVSISFPMSIAMDFKFPTMLDTWLQKHSKNNLEYVTVHWPALWASLWSWAAKLPCCVVTESIWSSPDMRSDQSKARTLFPLSYLRAWVLLVQVVEVVV